jgi:hypothetical protein
LNISVAPILQFAAAMERDPMVKVLAESISKANGKDHIRMTQKAVERGVAARLEIEEGVLQLIGTATTARNRQGN